MSEQERELENRILEYLIKHGDSSCQTISEDLGETASRTLDAMRSLQTRGEVSWSHLYIWHCFQDT